MDQSKQSVALTPEPALAMGGGEHSHNVIYLLRTTHQYHTQMAMLADQKASILVGVCLVVFTVILSRWPTESMSVALLVLGATAVIAALLAIMAVIPAFRWNQHSRGEPNPLFFGSFAQLSEQEYLDRMHAVIRDDPSVYSAMIRDIYHQGRILYTRKYRFLSYSYRVFAIGLVLTVATAAFDLWRGA